MRPDRLARTGLRRLTDVWPTPPHTKAIRLCSLLSLGLLASAVGTGSLTRPALAADPCAPPVTNPIPCENSQPGTDPLIWQAVNDSPSIVGFATDISVNVGGSINFKVNTSANSYSLTIYRLGYYGGLGARQMATVTPSVSLPQKQPACLVNSATELVDCGNWALSASWTVPTTAVSGIYLAKLQDTKGNSNHIPFVVRNDGSTSDLLFQTSDTTWQAYNAWGGNSLYQTSNPNNPAQRAYKVSYNRPWDTDTVKPESWVFNAEYPMLRWLEANGYNVSYTTGLDSDRNGTLIKNHKVFLSVGHDEYWSKNQRANVEAARSAGVNLAFFSGNEVFWKTRWENSIDATNTPYRTLVTYKETAADAVIDPADPPTWTGTWRDPRFSPPADGGRPENSLTGNIFMVNGPDYEALKVPAADGKMRFWRNTSAANLAPGQTNTYLSGCGGCIIGYEWDEDLDNGSRPPGTFQLSTTTANVLQLLVDYGVTYQPGTATHHLTMYRDPGGALVFGAGTVGWAYALDGNSAVQPSTPEPDIQQATVNLFADMRVQPATLQPGLVAATASADTTPPTSTIVSPAAGAGVVGNTTVTVTGTAVDSGGGNVAGVEVSVDGGSTWHAASGRGNWSYSWKPATLGQVTIKSRAVDDSGNMEIPSAGVTVTVTSPTCPCTIWSGSPTPSSGANPDPSAVEVGVKFRSDLNGQVSGIRFYKFSTNTGTHIGDLWDSSGNLLASATFTNETASGWQQVTFAAPVAITANTTYVASYHTNVGNYAADSSYFLNSGVDNLPLHAPSSSAAGGNGVYAYGATSTFPNNSFNATNYWVDVVLTNTSSSGPPTVTSESPSPSATGVAVTTSVTATFNQPVTASTISFALKDPTNNTVPSTVTYNSSTNTATLQPNAALAAAATYTATVSGATNSSGQVMSPFSWSFTTASSSGPPSVTSESPSPGATGVVVTTSVTATFNEPVTPSTVSFVLKDPSNNTVPSTVTYNSSTNTATLRPNANLALGTTYTATVSGATDVLGKVMIPFSWSFTTKSCPCSIWSSTATPGAINSSDTNSVEVGVKFRSDVNGFISGIRFYKGTANTGTHVGNLWTSTGSLLASATFSNETASGWQQVSFASLVAVTANTTYVASYHASVGGYAQDTGYFSSTGVDNAPLHAPSSASSGGNGVYAYGASSTFPNQTFNASNYWVDVVFTTTASSGPPTVTSETPGPNATGVSPQTTVNATFNEPVTGSTISFLLKDPSNTTVPSTVTYTSSTNTATLQPNAKLALGTTYTATVSGATDASGMVMTPFSWSFTTKSCPCTLWSATAAPGTVDSNDGNAVELGMKFSSDISGKITGIRFYKSTLNTGTHVGNLWSTTGTLLASATFTSETASGWQQMTFATPVAITGNTTYIVSYHTNVGHYSDDQAYFASAGLDNSPLHAPSSPSSGGNGVYVYGPTSSFPNQTFNASTYWVDVVFTP